MVIGAVGLRTLSSWLAEVSEQIGREINPHTITVEGVPAPEAKGDHFLSNVLESPKLFIIGSENDLAAMGDNGWLESHVTSAEIRQPAGHCEP